jgi:NAD(P)-dependent dehydrogenase (short-subunit alcohol dehydrogenase family)
MTSGMVGDMTGKAAIVTGAAGGLGRATAIRLADAGADVLLVDLKEAELAETAQMIGPKAQIHATDLSNGDNCAPVIAAAVAAFGRLDALCNVAGILRVANSYDMAVADWNLVMAVNLTAPFLLSQAAIPHLLATDGAIVNVTSSAAHIGEAYCAAYCASKGGLLQLTKSMAMEFLTKPLRINALSPGGMNTPIGASFVLPEGADLSLLARFRPQRGLVEVDETAAMVAMLVSPNGRGFHGSCVVMDKGLIAG